jgi:hypothetical protein
MELGQVYAQWNPSRSYGSPLFIKICPYEVQWSAVVDAEAHFSEVKMGSCVSLLAKTIPADAEALARFNLPSSIGSFLDYLRPEETPGELIIVPPPMV